MPKKRPLYTTLPKMPPPPHSRTTNTHTNLLRRRARLRLLRRPTPLAPLQRHRSLPRAGQLPLQLRPLLRRVRVRPPPLLPLRRPRVRRRRLGLPGRLRQRVGLPLVGRGPILLPRDDEGSGGLCLTRGLRLGAQPEAALPLRLGGGGDEPLGLFAEALALPGTGFGGVVVGGGRGGGGGGVVLVGCTRAGLFDGRWSA